MGGAPALRSSDREALAAAGRRDRRGVLLQRAPQVRVGDQLDAHLEGRDGGEDPGRPGQLHRGVLLDPPARAHAQVGLDAATTANALETTTGHAEALGVSATEEAPAGGVTPVDRGVLDADRLAAGLTHGVDHDDQVVMEQPLGQRLLRHARVTRDFLGDEDALHDHRRLRGVVHPVEGLRDPVAPQHAPVVVAQVAAGPGGVVVHPLLRPVGGDDGEAAEHGPAEWAGTVGVPEGGVVSGVAIPVPGAVAEAATIDDLDGGGHVAGVPVPVGGDARDAGVLTENQPLLGDVADEVAHLDARVQRLERVDALRLGDPVFGNLEERHVPEGGREVVHAPVARHAPGGSEADLEVPLGVEGVGQADVLEGVAHYLS